MKRLFACLIAAAALAAPAQAQVVEPSRVEAGFTISSLGAILSEMGYQSTQQSMPNGASALRVSGPSGLVFFLEPRACDSGRCVGLSFSAFYRRDVAYTTDELNSYNGQFAFMKAMALPDGGALLTRYIIADYGIPRGNIAVNLSVFDSLATRFPEVVNSSGEVTASLGGKAVMGASAFAGMALTAQPGLDHGKPTTLDVTDDMVNAH